MTRNELGNMWKEAVLSKFQAGVPKSRKTKFYTVAANVSGSWIWNCLMSPRWRPEFLVTTIILGEKKTLHYLVLSVFADGLRRTM